MTGILMSRMTTSMLSILLEAYPRLAWPLKAGHNINISFLQPFYHGFHKRFFVIRQKNFCNRHFQPPIFFVEHLLGKVAFVYGLYNGFCRFLMLRWWPSPSLGSVPSLLFGIRTSKVVPLPTALRAFNLSPHFFDDPITN